MRPRGRTRRSGHRRGRRSCRRSCPSSRPCRAVHGEAGLLQALGGARHGVVRGGAGPDEGQQVVGVAAVGKRRHTASAFPVFDGDSEGGGVGRGCFPSPRDCFPMPRIGGALQVRSTTHRSGPARRKPVAWPAARKRRCRTTRPGARPRGGRGCSGPVPGASGKHSEGRDMRRLVSGHGPGPSAPHARAEELAEFRRTRLLTAPAHWRRRRLRIRGRLRFPSSVTPPP